MSEQIDKFLSQWTGAHLSFMAGTQGSPLTAGPTDSTGSSAATNRDREGR
jgi:hypothetical protein